MPGLVPAIHVFETTSIYTASGQRSRSAISLPVLQNQIEMIKRESRGRRIGAVAALVSGLSIWLAAAGVGAEGLSSQHLITVRIAGDEFRIPRGYFYPLPPKDENRDSLLIHGLLPALSPVWGHEKEEFEAFPEGTLSGAVIILAMDAKRTTTLEFRFDATKRLGGPYEQQAAEYELELYMPKLVSKGWQHDEVYVDRNGGKLAGFITCDIDGKYPSPGCAHNFRYRGLLMQVTYRKPFLPRWRSIEQKIKDLLDSFMRQASLSGPQDRGQSSRKAVSLSPCMTMSQR